MSDISRFDLQPAVQRNMSDPHGSPAILVTSQAGEWVKYEDHLAAMNAGITTPEQAKQSILDAAGDVGEHANSLDQAADELLARVGQFFGECVGGDTFCGLAIDETRNADGLLQSLRLVACDLVSGEPVRRVAK